MRATVLTVGPLVAASANNIATTQTPTTTFTLNGTTVVSGVAVLDTPRRVLLTTAADESAKTVTIVGTDWNGQTQTEVLAGANAGTSQSVLDFKTVISVTASGAFAGAATLGTSGVASSRWMRSDGWASPTASVQCTVSGTVNYTVETSMQDPNSSTSAVLPYLVQWVSSPDPDVVAATATQDSYFERIPMWVRVTLNSGTGSVTTTITQFGSATY